jgi:hypothetical protein
MRENADCHDYDDNHDLKKEKPAPQDQRVEDPNKS